ncbi:MAG TPA: glycosyltransferase family 2 protein [Clostridiales bacterium]|jgi:dolichol-phosphate mannosyltransferase|nr:glycosyltransferase family 2 protein [Clostridiales bacterium]
MITVEKPTERTANSLLSVVIPMYQEGSHVKNTIKVIEKILVDNHITYEFILVDDGSTDNTFSELKSLAKDNDKVSAIRLSRNFGKESALCAGLDYAAGDMILVMDADLQHPPHIIPDMVNAWLNEGFDVVEGVKRSRGKENILYRACAKLFYFLVNKSSDINLERASDFKLMDRKVVEAWKKMPEKTSFFRGMSAWLGFERKEIEFDVAERIDGRSRWSLLRLIRLAVNAITSYTSIPLYFTVILGIILFFGAFILGVQTIFMKLSGRAGSGFTTVILLLLIIGSTIMTSLGIIGMYLSKIYMEVKARPRYLISDYIRGGDDKC